MEPEGEGQAYPGDPAGGPRVSVVIPTFDRRALVGEAIESVLGQIGAEVEVLVIDDGSTDGTWEALARTYGEEPRVRVFQKENGGTASARNRGLEEARAPYVGFLDSDDIWAPGCAASQVARLEAAGADAVLCDVAYEGWDRESDHLFGDPEFLAPLSMEAMLQGGWGLPTGTLCRTAVACSLRFDESFDFSEDTDFLFRFHAAGHRLVLNEQRLAVLRHHASGRKSDDRRVEHRAARVLMLRRHADRASVRRYMEHEIYTLHRIVANEFIAAGRWREARPHLAACARKRPYRPRVVWRWLRSLAARRREGVPSALSVQRAQAVTSASR